jgi:hypothetical protein
MRRLVLAVVLAAATLLLLPGEPAVAQGTTLPAPDFDNDGFGDLAVGVPGEDLGAAPDAGAVQVLYGAADGLVSDGQVLTQGAGGVPGASEGGDRFGAALVTGRFNSDAYEDLAVGVPGEDVGADGGAGAVVLLFGSAGGLGGGGRLLTQDNPEPGDGFGSALAVGEVSDSGQLLVGAPGEDVRSLTDAGAVSLISTPAGDPDESLLYQGVAGVSGTAEPGDAFGAALAVGDFNSSDGIDSLAVGAPGEDVGEVADAGAVIVSYAPGFGGPVGLRQLTQDRPEAGDRFGAALAEGIVAPLGGYADLAVGVFSDDGNSLAVGAPGEDLGPAADAGVLDVLYNSDSGLGGGGRQQLTQADAAGAVEAGDRFGASLSAPFFHESDVLEDLGVGAPGETVGGRRGAGAVSVVFGSAGGGLGEAGSQFRYQGTGGLGGPAESGDAVGAALG